VSLAPSSGMVWSPKDDMLMRTFYGTSRSQWDVFSATRSDTSCERGRRWTTHILLCS